MTAEIASRRAARILIAEDDPAAASVLDTLLRLRGYSVTVISDGAKVVEALEDCPPPDLIVLDWMLPGTSGLELCHYVRSRWDPVALPILMVTARTDAESITAAFEAGANDYLTKPFLGSELRARIAAQLRIKELVEERRRIDEMLMDREKLSSLGVLVSSVAHDLNNPLAGIMANAQLLQQDVGDGETGAMVGEILSDVQRCKRIIRDLLGFARRQPTEESQVDTCAVLQETLALRENHLRAMGIRLVKSLDPEAPRVTGVAHQLQQVFLNILINAEQAMRHGGDLLKVSLRASAGRPGVEVEIHNNGPRIPEPTLSRVFEPFFTTKAGDEGTGLGLAICDRIVRSHGGRITVDSSDSITVFRLTIPAAGARVSATAEPLWP